MLLPKLKPCPFCGDRMFYAVKRLEGKVCIMHGDIESEDICPIADTFWYDTHQEAAEAWNRRTP